MNKLEEILDWLKKIKALLDDIPNLIKVSAQQIVSNALSEINYNAGLLTAGEFRVGNGKDPGYGFTGVRMAYPAMTYAGDSYPFVSVSNDVLQVGISLSDGKLYAGQGAVIISSDGIIISPGVADVNKIKFINTSGYTAGAIYGTSTTENAVSLVTTITPGTTSCSIQLVAGSNASFLVGSTFTRLTYDGYYLIKPYPNDAVNSVRFADKDSNVILSIDTSNNRVGINNTTPQDSLHVTGGILVGGDSSGYDNTIGLTNVTASNTGSNAGTVEMGTGRPNAGWRKIMIGTTVAYEPYWTDIS